MSFVFEPFSACDSAREATQSLAEVFAMPMLPTVSLNLAELPPFHLAGGKGYYVSTLTRHVAFMLSQPSSLFISSGLESVDVEWIYRNLRVIVPVCLHDPLFVPCYAYAHIFAKDAYVLNSPETAYPSAAEVILAPHYALTAGQDKHAHAQALAYDLCLPGSQVIAVTDAEIMDKTDTAAYPHFSLQLLIRGHRNLPDYWQRLQMKSANL